MPPEFVRKIESEIRKPEIKKGAELDEETKEATLLFLKAHRENTDLSKKENDSLALAIEELKTDGPYPETGKWLKRPLSEEEDLRKRAVAAKNARRKKEWCTEESQFHLFFNARSKLIGKFKKLEEKDI